MEVCIILWRFAKNHSLSYSSRIIMRLKPLLLVAHMCFVLVMLPYVVGQALPPSLNLWTTYELTPGACNAQPVDLYGQSVKFTLNGTMMMARPLKKDGTYDDENKFALYVKSIVEQVGTNPAYNPPRRCLSDATILHELNLKNCSCSSKPYQREGPGYKDAGQILTFFDCRNHPTFNFELYMAIPNATHAEFYNTTVPGSTLDNFTYTSPYEASWHLFLLSLPLSGHSLLFRLFSPSFYVFLHTLTLR